MGVNVRNEIQDGGNDSLVSFRVLLFTLLDSLFPSPGGSALRSDSTKNRDVST